jgi:hypothetical protein
MPLDPYAHASAQAGYLQSVASLAPSRALREQKKYPPTTTPHTRPLSPQGLLQLHAATLLSMNPSLEIMSKFNFKKMAQVCTERGGGRDTKG